MQDVHDLTHVHLELGREPGHPEGDSSYGYDLLLPLGADGRLDAAMWKTHRDLCRVRRFGKGEPDRIGVLNRKPGGQWFFDYDSESESDNETGYHFGDEQFVVGEYVSLIEVDGETHAYRVTKVRSV